MPSSVMEWLPWVADWLIRLKPRSVIDIGCGVGMYGMLCRAGILGAYSFHGEGFQETGNFTTPRVDGVEIWPKYKAPWHAGLYSSVWWGTNALEMIDKQMWIPIRDRLPKGAPSWDVALLIDVIEHMTKEGGHRLLRDLDYGTAIIVTPPDNVRPNTYGGNPHEEHISSWSAEDFPGAQFCEVIPPRFMVEAKPKLCVVWKRKVTSST